MSDLDRVARKAASEQKMESPKEKSGELDDDEQAKDPNNDAEAYRKLRCRFS